MCFPTWEHNKFLLVFVYIFTGKTTCRIMLLVEQNSFLVNSSSIPKEQRYSVKSFLGSVVLIILPNWTQLLRRSIMLCTGLTSILWIGLQLGASRRNKVPTLLSQQVVSVCIRLTGFKLCTTTPNNTQQHVTVCENGTTCNIQQCWELLANNVASVCTDGNRIVLKKQ